MTDQPIPMRLPCPDCGELHVDEGDFATKPHHTHSCQHCGLTWRPAIVATVGVRFLPGFRNVVVESSTVDLASGEPLAPGLPHVGTMRITCEHGTVGCIGRGEKHWCDAGAEPSVRPAAPLGVVIKPSRPTHPAEVNELLDRVPRDEPRIGTDAMRSALMISAIVRKRRNPKLLAVTDRMRSMIATIFVSAFDSDVPVEECKRRSLCCCGHAKSYDTCLQIVGGRSHRAALKLRDFFYEELGCCGWRDKEYEALQEQYFLDKIANLETL